MYACLHKHIRNRISLPRYAMYCVLVVKCEVHYYSVCCVCCVWSIHIVLLLVFVTRLFSSHPPCFLPSPPPSICLYLSLFVSGASVSHSNKGPTQGGEFKKQLTDLMRTLGERKRRGEKRGEEGGEGGTCIVAVPISLSSTVALI